MALHKSWFFSVLFCSSISILIPSASSLCFNFSSFDPEVSSQIQTQNDASLGYGEINLTRYPMQYSMGRVVYLEPLLLWDAKTRELTDFITQFSFVIDSFNRSEYGDGLAFFLSPYPASQAPSYSAGGFLGLFSNSSLSNSAMDTVAVEFDTFSNIMWDPNGSHVGIDVNSIKSNVTVPWNIPVEDGGRVNARVSYIAATHNLSVLLTNEANLDSHSSLGLHLIVDLRDVLPEKVAIGFSASTGNLTETHSLLSWSFSSNLQPRKTKAGLLFGLVIGVAVFMAVLGLLSFICFKKKGPCRNGRDVENTDIDDDEFESGPKRFPYEVLAEATRNFSEERKLGEGGFGLVYRGYLNELKTDVAIKRISKGSKQGRKEYISEVKIISQLRHRNLVQLIGWCHNRAGEFLLVYEFMPNGSLDLHLHSSGKFLEWPTRHKIAMGLASALLYLHEEWEQCVVHRDVKPNNVMLDAAFTAKLGDFGLARLVDHDSGLQTTELAGTRAYMAPECFYTGKASKESDVYSFGIVALEIACGRRPVEPAEGPSKVTLVEWAWELYGRGAILEAADERLNGDFDRKQVECLMVVGLWCAHPDHNRRPSIKQVVGALNSEAPLPVLPTKRPVPTFESPSSDTYVANLTTVSLATTMYYTESSSLTLSSTSS